MSWTCTFVQKIPLAIAIITSNNKWLHIYILYTRKCSAALPAMVVGGGGDNDTGTLKFWLGHVLLFVFRFA